MRWSGSQIHVVLCQAIGVRPVHGSGKAVAEALGVAQAKYSDARSNRSTTVDRLSRWIHAAGLPVDIVLRNGEAIAVLRDEEAPEPARVELAMQTLADARGITVEALQALLDAVDAACDRTKAAA